MRLALLFVLSACGAAAARVDVSSESFATLGMGDRLFVDFGVWNFPAPGVPTQVTVTVRSGYDVSGFFEAVVQSLDGALRFDAGSGGFAPGWWSGGGYTGAIGVAAFGVALTAAEADGLFGPDARVPWTGAAAAAIANSGGAVRVGIPGLWLRDAVTVTLSDGTTSVGAAGGGIYVERASYGAIAADATPEPGTLAGVGLGLLAGLAVMARKARLRPRRDMARKTVDYEAASLSRVHRRRAGAVTQLQHVCQPAFRLLPSSWQIGILPLKCRQTNHGVK